VSTTSSKPQAGPWNDNNARYYGVERSDDIAAYADGADDAWRWAVYSPYPDGRRLDRGEAESLEAARDAADDALRAHGYLAVPAPAPAGQTHPIPTAAAELADAHAALVAAQARYDTAAAVMRLALDAGRGSK
jgi:hypothetical protein